MIEQLIEELTSILVENHKLRRENKNLKKELKDCKDTLDTIAKNSESFSQDFLKSVISGDIKYDCKSDK